MEKIVLSEPDIARINISRRRPLQPQNQKDVVLKKLRAQGEEYPDRKRGAALMTPPIPHPEMNQICRCRKEGCALNGQVKGNLFDQFRAHDNQIQSMIIMNSIDITTPKVRSVPGAQNVKEFTYKYHVLVNGMSQDVCRQTLLNIFGISVARLNHVIDEINSGKLVPEDHRGKHQNRPNKVPDAAQDEIRTHIQGYRTYESHYNRPRAPAGTRYFSPDLNISIMFEDFLQGQRDNGREECEQWVYHSIFNSEFPKLSLCTPKTDTCDECDKYKAQLHDATAQERTEIQESQLCHHTECELAYESYKNDGNRATADPNYVVLTVGLQQVMFTPGMRNSAAFYLRKLSNYNLGIHRASDGNVKMHLWTELVASRGSNEICSCIWDYIRTS